MCLSTPIDVCVKGREGQRERQLLCHCSWMAGGCHGIMLLSIVHTCVPLGEGQEGKGWCVYVYIGMIIEYICLRTNPVYCSDISFTKSCLLHDDTLDCQLVLYAVMTLDQ